jgi:hypothetical protein
MRKSTTKMSVTFCSRRIGIIAIDCPYFDTSFRKLHQSKMYSSLSRNVARSGARRVVATANRRSVSNTTAAAGRRLQNSHAITADVTALPLPVSRILGQQRAALLAGGAAGVAVLSSSSAIAMCDGGSVSEEEMQHDWDDFMYKAIKPGEDDDDEDDDDDDDDDDDEDDDEVSI